MRKRNSRELPFRKIFFALVMVIISFGVLYLFLVGFFSLISLAPKISTEKEEELVDPVAESASSFELEKIANEKNISFESINESSKSAVIIARIKEGPEVYFSKAKDSKFQMDSLQIILSKLTIDNKKPSLIDMRYTRPIVKF